METPKIMDFQVNYKLGEGAFSNVYKVTRKSDQKTYAMKKVKMNKLSEKEKQNALNEVRILASINTPNIIGYKEAFYDDKSQCLCIVQEYADGGDLLSVINAAKKKKNAYVQEDQIWDWAIQMLTGLKNLHDKQIMHRDLKAANIFLMKDTKIAKLGDLNVSKVTKNKLAYTQTGTPYYASPEIWKDSPYNSKCDIWSFGCVIYEVCALKPPFQAQNIEGLYKKIQRGSYERIPTRYSQDLQSIISLCLQTNPASRPDVDSLLKLSSITKRTQQKSNMMAGGSPKSKSMTDNSLINTIRVPKNLKQLKERLPKAAYQSQADVQIYKDNNAAHRSPRSHSIENNSNGSYRNNPNLIGGGSRQGQRKLNALKPIDSLVLQRNNSNNNNKINININNDSNSNKGYIYQNRNRAGSLQGYNSNFNKQQKPQSPRKLIPINQKENNANSHNMPPQAPKNSIVPNNSGGSNQYKSINTPQLNNNQNVKVVQYQNQRSNRRLRSSDRNLKNNNIQQQQEYSIFQKQNQSPNGLLRDKFRIKQQQNSVLFKNNRNNSNSLINNINITNDNQQQKQQNKENNNNNKFIR